MSARVAVLASGRGSNLAALADASALHDAQIALVVVDRVGAGAVQVAAERGLRCIKLPRARGEAAAHHEARLRAVLDDAAIDWVCLAGYLRLLSAGFLLAQRGRVLNIHPSLLPALPGLHAIERAHRQALPQTGVTVHLVDDGVDTGPIVVQAPVPLVAGEALAALEARVHAVEHRLYPQALRLAARGDLDDRVAALLSALEARSQQS